jgi:hypothetical protein
VGLRLLQHQRHAGRGTAAVPRGGDDGEARDGHAAVALPDIVDTAESKRRNPGWKWKGFFVLHPIFRHSYEPVVMQRRFLKGSR